MFCTRFVNRDALQFHFIHVMLHHNQHPYRTSLCWMLNLSTWLWTREPESVWKITKMEMSGFQNGCEEGMYGAYLIFFSWFHIDFFFFFLFRFERKSSKFHYQLLEPGNIRAIPYKNMVIWPYTLTSSSLQCLLCRALILCKTQVYNFNDLKASLWLRI